MALANSKSENFYVTTGGGADEIDSTRLTNITAMWATDKAEGCKNLINDPIMGPIVFQLQQMQEEIHELRRYIVSAELLLPNTMGDSLPTSDPGSGGQLWNDREILRISR